MRFERRVILKREEIYWNRIGISNYFQRSSTLICKAELQRCKEKSYLSSWLVVQLHPMPGGAESCTHGGSDVILDR
jgi:hypothetical protein